MITENEINEMFKATPDTYLLPTEEELMDEAGAQPDTSWIDHDKFALFVIVTAVVTGLYACYSLIA